MGFYLVPFCQPNPPTQFLSITGQWNVSLPSDASLWKGMFGRVKGQYTTFGFNKEQCSNNNNYYLRMNEQILNKIFVLNQESAQILISRAR